MKEEKTIILVSPEVRNVLEGMKQRNPGQKGTKARESYDQVLRRVLDKELKEE